MQTNKYNWYKLAIQVEQGDLFNGFPEKPTKSKEQDEQYEQDDIRYIGYTQYGDIYYVKFNVSGKTYEFQVNERDFISIRGVAKRSEWKAFDYAKKHEIE